jgi:hypothetical protein
MLTQPMRFPHAPDDKNIRMREALLGFPGIDAAIWAN